MPLSSHPQTNSSSAEPKQHSLSNPASQTKQQSPDEPDEAPARLPSNAKKGASHAPISDPKGTSVPSPITMKYFGCAICHDKFTDLAACAEHMEKRHHRVAGSQSEVKNSQPPSKTQPKYSAKGTLFF